MFNKLFFLMFLAVSFSATAAKKLSPKEESIETLLTTIQVNDFVKHISQIKKHKSVSEIKDIDYKLKKFFKNLKLWYYFDEVNFKKGLINKLDKGLSASEIKEINEIFKKPFLLKVLNASILHRDLFDYNKDSVDEAYKVPELASSRYTLISNLYNLYGMGIQKDELDKRLKKIVKSGKVMLTVLDKKNKGKIFVNPVELEKRLKTTKEFIVMYLAKDLKDFRHYEIREFLRKFKQSRTSQKFLQLYANYHFLYMSKYINKIESDKMNQLKSLEVLK